MLIVIQTLRNRKLVRTKFRFMSSVRYSVLNRYLGLEVPKLVDLIDTNMSLVSSTLNIIPLLYLDLLEVKENLILSFTNLSTRKLTRYEKKLLRKVGCVFSVKL